MVLWPLLSGPTSVICGCVHVGVYMWVCTCGCVHVGVYMWVCACGCVHVCVYMWVCTCGCVHVCVYMWINIHENVCLHLKFHTVLSPQQYNLYSLPSASSSSSLFHLLLQAVVTLAQTALPWLPPMNTDALSLAL